MRRLTSYLAVFLIGCIAGGLVVGAVRSESPRMAVSDEVLATELSHALASFKQLQLLQAGSYSSVERGLALEFQGSSQRAEILTGRGAALHFSTGDLRAIAPVVRSTIAAAGLPSGAARDFATVARRLAEDAT